VRRWFGPVLCVIAVLLLAADSGDPNPAANDAPADDANTPRRTAHLIPVPLPIKGSVDDRIKQTTNRLLEALKESDERPVFIFEFRTGANESGASSEFERSLSLARYLASDRLNAVQTVAYIPRTIEGHSVLAALACEQIIMHPDAEIGAAGISEASIDPTVRRGYAEIANRRRTVPTAIALGMLDKRLAVSKVNGNRYVLADELETLKQQGAVTTIETVIPEGEMGRFTGRELRLEHGFASHLVNDRLELARVLQLRPGDLEIDPSRGGGWHAIQVNLEGPINTRAVTQAQRGIEEKLTSGATNFILLQIDSAGGSPDASVIMAGFLDSLDDTTHRTVAFIPSMARSDAAIIAMACDHVVMSKRAKLGGTGGHRMSDDEVKLVRETIRDSISVEKSRSWSLWAAMIDPELVVYRCEHRGTGQVAYFCQEELDEQVDPAAWEKGQEETMPGEPLQVDGERAEKLGLARYLAQNVDEVKQLYQIEQIEQVRPNWAHELIDALADPWLAGALLFIGSFAMMSEMMSPGIGVAGFISCVCFVLYFWSQFLHGTAGWLEVLLFATGVVCVALEVFVIPGFGIFGLGGGAMILAALVLATQTFVIPRNDYQLEQIPQSLFSVAAIAGGVIAALALMRHFLPKAPVVNQMVLQPPDSEELEDLSRREALADFGHLLGKRGVASTQLTPSGKARFGDDLVDVITDGEVVSKDTAVAVVDVQGNRVLVRAIE